MSLADELLADLENPEDDFMIEDPSTHMIVDHPGEEGTNCSFVVVSYNNIVFMFLRDFIIMS